MVRGVAFDMVRLGIRLRERRMALVVADSRTGSPASGRSLVLISQLLSGHGGHATPLHGPEASIAI